VILAFAQTNVVQEPLRATLELFFKLLVACHHSAMIGYAEFGSDPKVRSHHRLMTTPPFVSERQLMERLEFDLLFRWFVGMGVDDRAWDHSTFSKCSACLALIISRSLAR
jgi:Transposase domain (DUF772)